MSENNKKTILVIDDVTMDLISIKSILSKTFDVRVAKSEEQGLFILGSMKIDLILLNIEMAGVFMFETFDKIKTITGCSNFPVIFTSFHITQELKNKIRNVGVIDYVTKPYNSVIIQEKVNGLLGLE